MAESIAVALAGVALWLGTGHGVYSYAHGSWLRRSVHPVSAISAVDARHAWAVADQGQTIRTTDGVRWRTLGVQHLVALSFVDPRDGFALDRDGILLRTGDGGLRWTHPFGFRLQALCFADARTGWVAKRGTVWTTHDGGTRWTHRTLLREPDGNPAIPSLACRGRDVWATFTTGAAAGSGAYAVFHSRDAGATWKLVYAQFLGAAPRVDAYLTTIALTPAGAAVEGDCPACGRGRVSILYGGRRSFFDGWQPGPLAFSNADVGALALVRGSTVAVFRTRDGTRTWRRIR